MPRHRWRPLGGLPATVTGAVGGVGSVPIGGLVAVAARKGEGGRAAEAQGKGRTTADIGRFHGPHPFVRCTPFPIMPNRSGF